MTENNRPGDKDLKRIAWRVIILFGLVSLFGDIVYEGARSVNGPYLKLLAVNAATLGIIVGLGEFLGYALRLLSGYLSDRSRAYWPLTFLGYAMLISVPLLGLTSIWQAAAVLIIAERIGKAVRSPARDTILSQANSWVGTGFGFGLHEAMDQIGAVSGPLIFTAFFVIAGKHVTTADYQKAYSFLWIPFVLVMLCVFIAFRNIPHPEVLRSADKNNLPDKLSGVFWSYNLFTFLATAGFFSFVLLAYHFKSSGDVSDAHIPLFYALAMGIDAVAALIVGKYYDVLKKKHNDRNAGLNLLIVIPLLSLMIPFFVFTKSTGLIIAGVLCWGIVMGIHETIMRSAIADITSFKKRGTGYGIFNATYGLAFFLGSALMGFLYDHSISLVIFAIVFIECLALIAFVFMKRETAKAAALSQAEGRM